MRSATRGHCSVPCSNLKLYAFCGFLVQKLTMRSCGYRLSLLLWWVSAYLALSCNLLSTTIDERSLQWPRECLCSSGCSVKSSSATSMSFNMNNNKTGYHGSTFIPYQSCRRVTVGIQTCVSPVCMMWEQFCTQYPALMTVFYWIELHITGNSVRELHPSNQIAGKLAIK